MFLELGMAFPQVERLFLLNCERSITCLMFLLIIPNQILSWSDLKCVLVCIPICILNSKTESFIHISQSKPLCVEKQHPSARWYLLVNVLTPATCVRAQLLQSCPTMCGTVGCGLPGSSIDGLLHARMLEHVARPSSRVHLLEGKSNVEGEGRIQPPCLSVQFSHSVMPDSLWRHEPQHARPPCPSPTPGVYSNSCPSSLWCHPPISSSVVPFSSCPQSFPRSGSFPVSKLFLSGGQSIGVSALASVRRHPSSKVRSNGCTLPEQPWRDTPRPR